LKPFGHLGFSALTFVVLIPLVHEIVFFVFFTAEMAEDGKAVGDGVGMGVGVVVTTGAGTSCLMATRTVGLEYVKPAALRESQPSFCATFVVATWADPSEERTETVALIGASENP
jgi:hypothetical protein